MRSESAYQIQLPLTRNLDLQRRTKAAVGRAMKACGLSREQIADRINEALEAEGNPYRVSAAALDRWAAPSDTTHNIFAWLAPLFCRVTGNRELVALQAEALGMALAGEEEMILIRMASARRKRQEAAREERRALEALEDLERGRA